MGGSADVVGVPNLGQRRRGAANRDSAAVAGCESSLDGGGRVGRAGGRKNPGGGEKSVGVARFVQVDGKLEVVNELFARRVGAVAGGLHGGNASSVLLPVGCQKSASKRID